MATVVGDLVVFLRANTVQFNTGMATASAQLNKMGKQMSTLGRQMTTRMSLPMAAVGAAAIKMSSDFETSMSQIVGLVGVAQDQVNQWREDIIKLGPAVAKTSTELGSAMFFITSAGLRGATALSALEASAKGASAGLGQTEVVADAATSAMNAYGAANLSAEQAVAVLVSTVREGKAAASEIAPVIGAIIPVASELGVEFHEVGAALSAMTRLGLNASEASTALRSTLSTILKPTTQAADEMEKYGMSMGDLKTVLREDGLIALLTKLKETFKGNEDSMQNVFRNVRALNGVLSIVGGNAKENVKIFDSLAKTTEDDLNRAFEVASETAQFKFNAALSDIQNTMIELGQVLIPAVLPAITNLGEAFRDVTEFLDKLNPAQRTLIANAGLLVIALGPLTWAFGKVTAAAGLATGAVANWNRVMLATPAATAGAKLSVEAMALALGVKLPAGAAAGKIGVAAAFGGIFKTAGAAAIGVSSLTIALGAIFALIGVGIGTKIRPFVNEMLGLNEAFGLVAHKASDLTDGMLSNQDSWDASVSVLEKLKKQLKLTGKEWEFATEKTRTNAERIQMLTDKALKLAKAQRETVEVVNEEATARERALGIHKNAHDIIAPLAAAANKAEEERLALLREELGLFNKGDIAKGMEDMVKLYDDMKQSGVDRNQLGEHFSDEMMKWLKLAEENKVAIPKGVKEMGDELDTKVNPAINKMLVNWRPFHVNVKDTGKVIDGMFDPDRTDQIGIAIGGGFKKGVNEGITHGTVEMDKFVKRIEDDVIYIPVQPNFDSWNKAVDDYIEGRVPDTGG